MDKIGTQLRMQLAKVHRSSLSISKNISVSRSTINDILHNRNRSIKKLEEICEEAGLKITIEER